MIFKKDELPVLPRSWVWTTVGDVYKVVGGGTPSTKVDHYWTGTTPWITSADIQGVTDIRIRKYITKEAIENSATNLVPEGSLVVVTRVGLGKIALTETPICFSQDAQALIGNDSYIDPYYALHFLSQAIQVFKWRSRGTTISGVTTKQLKELDFAFPPFSEQQRIVAKIEELFTNLDAGIETLKKVQAQIKRYRQAVLKYAFAGKLTAEWREANKDKLEPASVLLERIREERKKKLGGKYKEPVEVDTSELPELPDGWVWVSLGALVDFRNGINFGAHQKGTKGFPTIDVLNMYSTSIYVKTDNLYRVEIDLHPDYLLEDSDLLFVRSSVKREGVGWASLFRDQAEPHTYCGFIIRARLPIKEALPSYLAYFYRMNSTRNTLIGSASQVTITNISQGALGKMMIPFAPLSEQEEIVQEIERRLSIAGQIEKVIEQSVMQSSRLRQSILKKAFEGKLVPQDPTDEPADKLLERIQEERAKHEAAMKKSKGKARSKK